MTARFFIIRGSFITLWYFYQSMSDWLVDSRVKLDFDLLLIFGLVTLATGLTLKWGKPNGLKLVLALALALIGFGLGFWGILTSWPAFAKVIDNQFYFSLKAASSLFFGLLLVFLYSKSLRELAPKVFA